MTKKYKYTEWSTGTFIPSYRNSMIQYRHSAGMELKIDNMSCPESLSAVSVAIIWTADGAMLGPAISEWILKGGFNKQVEFLFAFEFALQ